MGTFSDEVYLNVLFSDVFPRMGKYSGLILLKEVFRSWLPLPEDNSVLLCAKEKRTLFPISVEVTSHMGLGTRKREIGRRLWGTEYRIKVFNYCF